MRLQRHDDDEDFIRCEHWTYFWHGNAFMKLKCELKEEVEKKYFWGSDWCHEVKYFWTDGVEFTLRDYLLKFDGSDFYIILILGSENQVSDKVLAVNQFSQVSISTFCSVQFTSHIKGQKYQRGIGSDDLHR